MRIVYITSFYPPDRIAGAELGTQVMAEHMASLGHDVHVLITRPMFAREKECSRGGVQIHWLQSTSMGGCRMVSEVFLCLQLLFKLRPDVIQGNCLLPGALVAVLYKMRFPVRTISLCYGYDVCDMRGVVAKLGRWALRRVDCLLAATQYCSSVIMAQQQDLKPDVFLAGCNSGSFPYRPKRHRDPSAPYLLLFVGRLIPEKGLDFLLSLMPVLGEGYRLKVIGSGDRDHYLAMVQDMGLEGRVVFDEYVPNSELHVQFELADCLVLPSYREPFGVVCIESICSALPVVCARTMGLPEAVRHGENGLVVSGRSPDQWVKAIETCCSDEVFREKTFRASLEMRASWCWSERLLDLEAYTFAGGSVT